MLLDAIPSRIVLLLLAAVAGGLAKVINVGGVMGWRSGVQYDTAHAAVGDVLVSLWLTTSSVGSSLTKAPVSIAASLVNRNLASTS